MKCLADKKAASLTIVSRRIQDDTEFETFAAGLHAELISYNELDEHRGDILVNCTPVGMYPNVEESPVLESVVVGYQAVVDLIYNPKTTKLLAWGAKHGAVTLNGMYMLVAQAVGAEEIWQERRIDSAVIEAISKEMEKQYEK